MDCQEAVLATSWMVFRRYSRVALLQEKAKSDSLPDIENRCSHDAMLVHPNWTYHDDFVAR